MNNGQTDDQGKGHSLNDDETSAFSERPTDRSRQQSSWWRQAWNALLTPTSNPRFPTGPRQRPLIGYLAAILLQMIIGISTILLTQTSPTLGFPGGLILLAIPITALIWGTGPSIVAVFSGAALLTYLRLSHYFSHANIQSENIISLFLYLIIGLTISLLASQTQNTRYRAALETNRLHRYYEELVAQLLTERQARQASEHKIQAREEQLKAIFEVTTDAIFIFDTVGTSPQMNKAAKSLLDLTPDAETSLPFERLFDPLDRAGKSLPPEARPEARLLKGERLSGSDNMLIRTHTGEIRTVTITGISVRDADNTIIGAIMISHEVAERHLDMKKSESQ